MPSLTAVEGLCYNLVMIVTSIGSLPFVDVDRAIDLIFASCPEAPFWPQLPRRSFFESMYAQSLEGVPAIVMDEDARSVYMDTRKTDRIEAFYEDYSSGNIEPFALSDRAAPGFYRLLERLGEVRHTARIVKTQLAGPFTLGLGIKDQDGKPVLYDAAYFDIIKKALRMRAQWMIRTIRASYPEKEVILFFDEPAMVSFGSAFVSVSREDVTSCIDDVAAGLDATVGVHCCGNTDWPVLLGANIDIINYDACNFMDTLFYFQKELAGFISGGGSIAPGIVPSDETVEHATADDMKTAVSRFMEHFRALKPAGERGLLVTTSCGLGSLEEKHAIKALQLLSALGRL